MGNLDQVAVENFREYLRIRSVHPNPDYGKPKLYHSLSFSIYVKNFLDGCVTFLEKQAESLGLPIRIYYFFPNKPVVIITWTGKEPQLPSILLNGHTDVVPVFEVGFCLKPLKVKLSILYHI